MTIPTPGIYEHVPAAEYHRWPLPSNSLLGHMARSPLHCRHEMDHPTAQTPDMLIGEAFHAYVLEPDTFAARFVVARQCEAEKRGGDRCGNDGRYLISGRWICGVHAPKGYEPDDDRRSILARDDVRMLADMTAMIVADSWASSTLALPGMTEVSVVFDDPETGVRCKMRCDRVVTDRRRRCIVDLKSTRDASPAGFARSIYERGYHRQGAMYLRGCAAAGVDVDGFVLVAAEKEPPYGVGVYQLEDEDLAAGDAEVTRLLALYAGCAESNNWPGYGDGLQVIRLPRWARRRSDGQQAELVLE